MAPPSHFHVAEEPDISDSTLPTILATLVPPHDFARVLTLALKLGDPIDAVCTRLGLCSETDVVTALSRALHLPAIRAVDFPATPLLTDLLSPEFLRSTRACPLSQTATSLRVAMVDPTDATTLQALSFATDLRISPVICSATDFEAAWDRLYREDATTGIGKAASAHADDIERLTDLASDAPVIRYVNQIVARAIDLRASDIHLEPVGQTYQVRFRLDGMLQKIEEQPGHFGEATVSRIKIMARLNIAERRLAQDGRFRVNVRGQAVDLRVATTPTVHGEAVVLRILDSERVPLDLAALGFTPALAGKWMSMLDRPHGILLVTGPTGCGKSTTLYASLTRLNQSHRKLLTIEDPVEQQIPGVNQVHAQPGIGFGFGAALRAFLRHDPDVIMVGEIRDQETARTAIQAALTGHLILSTLHTNDAVSGITRLLDMGIDDYLIASTVLGILAQRLVRTVCPVCRGRENTVRHCTNCGGSGYKGRTTIGELVPVTTEMRSLIERNAGYEALRRQAMLDGMIPLAVDGAAKVQAGITTAEEIGRATLEA